MDWKGPLAATFFAGIILCTGFWTEPMWPLGDDRWLYLAGVFALGLILTYAIPAWWSRRKRAPDPLRADYMTALGIVDEYIQYAIVGMSPGVKVSVRHEMLEQFGKSTGAILGNGVYNSQRLHLWMQTNAARLLVEHRGDMK